MKKKLMFVFCTIMVFTFITGCVNIKNNENDHTDGKDTQTEEQSQIVSEKPTASMAENLKESDAAVIINSNDKITGSSFSKDMTNITLNCYLDDINYPKSTKIKIIPATEITYEEYDAAMNTNKKISLDGKQYLIDDSTADYGYIKLAGEHENYSFTEPDQEHWPSSVIESYTGREPIVVDISDNLIIRYGVLGYDSSNDPYGYESLGRNTVLTASEYFPHFEEYSFGSYYRATIKNGKLIILDVLYHP